MKKHLKTLFFVGLISSALSSVCSDESGTENQTSEYRIGTIPGLNTTVTFKKAEKPEAPFQRVGLSIIPHLYLACLHQKSGAVSLRNQVAQHLFLWAGKTIVGLLSTASHEVGHAMVMKHSDFTTDNPAIQIFYSPLAVASGIYTGKTNVSERAIQGISSLRKDDDKNSKVIVTDREIFLAWAHRYQSRCSQSIANFIAGPMVGLISAPLFASALSYVQPRMCDMIVNKKILIPMLCGVAITQNLLNLCPVSKNFDGYKAFDAWQKMKEVERIKSVVSTLEESSPVTLDFEND